MKVAFLTPSISPKGGGIFEIQRRLAQSLATIPGVDLEVFCVESGHREKDLQDWKPLKPRAFPYMGPFVFRYSPYLTRAFLCSDAEVAHLHALWMHTSIVTQKWAHKTKRPYMISLYGMLDSWALNNSAWKKRIALLLFERQNLHRASCIHVNSLNELESARALGLKNPICILPPGVDIPADSDTGGSLLHGPLSELKQTGRNILLYLGRIHPKKGLVNLVRAWNSKPHGNGFNEEWKLAIGGWDQGSHEAELKQLATELGVPWTDLRNERLIDADHGASLFFLGPQFGRAKNDLYRLSDAVILPSYSEGLPMAVLEAWSHSRPVLMTPECNLPEGFSAAAAIAVEAGENGIKDGLRRLFEMSDEERRTMGGNGLKLVFTRFSWPKIADEMHGVYEWMIGDGPLPDHVQMV